MERIFKSRYRAIYLAAGSRADSVARALEGVELLDDPTEEVTDAPAPSSERSEPAAEEEQGGEQGIEAQAEVSTSTAES